MKKIALVIFLSIAVTCSYSQQDSLVTRIYFDFGKSTLSAAAIKTLDQFISDHLKPEKIKISGQTDTVGSHAFNDRLSENRANEVYQYLFKKGMDTSVSHEVAGYGKRNAMVVGEASNINQLNRVVVVTAYLKRSNDPVTTLSEQQQPAPTQQKSFEQQLKEGSSKIVMNNLGFVPGQHVLLPASIPVLENVLETLKKYPALEIEIQGHVCCTDSMEVDGIDIQTGERALSVNRAKAVFDWLVASGISANRMSFKGFGASKRLVYPERNETDMSANRRVEFKIVKQ